MKNKARCCVKCGNVESYSIIRRIRTKSALKHAQSQCCLRPFAHIHTRSRLTSCVTATDPAHLSAASNNSTAKRLAGTTTACDPLHAATVQEITITSRCDVESWQVGREGGTPTKKASPKERLLSLGRSANILFSSPIAEDAAQRLPNAPIHSKTSDEGSGTTQTLGDTAPEAKSSRHP